MSLVKISGILNKCNIKFNQIAKYTFVIHGRCHSYPSLWLIDFSPVLSNKLLKEAGIVAFIPRYKISTKVVIKEIPEI